VLDRIQVWQGSRVNAVPLSEVEDWIEQASRTFNSAPARLDPWQTIGSAQRLSARGLRVEEFAFSSQSVGRIASVLHRLLRDRLLALPNDEDLLDELRNIRLRESAPGVVRLDNDSDRHDDRAVALALAAHKIVEDPPAGPLHAGFVDDTVRPEWLPDDDLETLRWSPAGADKLSHGMRL
jgi:hypothetical protein